MSIRVLTWVLEHSPAEGSARLVQIVLADKANDDGTGAYPSIETIGRQARIRSRTTVKDALKKLQALDQIERAGESQWGTKVWTVTMRAPEGGSESDPRSDPGARGPETDPEPSKPSSPDTAFYRRADPGSGPANGAPDQAALAAWEDTRQRLQAGHPDVTYHLWLQPLELAAVNGRAIDVAAPDHIRTLVRDRYLPAVTTAATAAFGRDLAVNLIGPGGTVAAHPASDTEGPDA